MGFQSGSGASAAAGEIATLVDAKIIEIEAKEGTNLLKEEVIKILEEIKERARSIKVSADGGWY